MMKRKHFLSKVAVCVLAVSLCIPQASAVYFANSGYAVDSNNPFGLFVFSETVLRTGKQKFPTGVEKLKEFTHRAGELVDISSRYSSFEELYTAFSSPENDENLKKLLHYDDLTSEGTVVFTSQSHLAMMIESKPTNDITLSSQLEVTGRSAQIGTINVNDTVTLNLSGGIKVSEGGTLVIMNDDGIPDARNMNLKIQLGDSIVVEDDSYLLLQSTDTLSWSIEDVGGNPTSPNKIIAPSGKPAIVVNGGTVKMSHQSMERASGDTSEGPLIQVNSGEVSFEPSSDSKNGIPQFSEGLIKPSYKFNFELDNGESNAPAIQVGDEATVTIKTGELTTAGNAPVFELAEGATLTLEGGNITNTGDKSAITVAEGATLVIPEKSTVAVTTNAGDGKAIDLVGGAKVRMAGTEVTVADGVQEGENFVDNDGNVILSKGATKGKETNTMNAAVILPDGTIIEGSDTKAPEVTTDESGTTTVTVPAGGAVQKPGEEKQELSNGGTVSKGEEGETEVTPTLKPATGITLDNTNVTLYSNTTPNTVTLTATVTPADTTDSVAWSSSDESVATVAGGVVTAVANGTATITATVGVGDQAKTATCAVTVTTYSSGGGSSDPTYAVSIPSKVEGGTIKTSPRYAEKGQIVTLTVTPDEGYQLDKLTVTDKDGDALKLTDKGDGKYTFTMPASKVTVNATFAPVVVEPENPFTDVAESAYYYDAVLWAVKNDITSGTSATTFSPTASCTRAQMVTFLWRAAGSPAVTGESPFTDVKADAYYYDAVLWAVQKGITNGATETTFAPDATVTRGQTVTFLYRNAGSPAATGDTFTDVPANAYYANAVAWAVAEDITNGTSETTFSPNADCTRGQIVTFLYRDQA